jgi:GT2 family glycosyltransferase
VLVARVVVGEECRPDPTSQVMARSPLRALPSDPGTPVLGFLAGASVIRREAFLAAGGFDERYFIGGEEELLAIDLVARGWRMSYVPSLVVRHLPSPKRDDAARRRYLARDALWTAWLRRSRATALRRTARALRDGLHDRCALAGLVAAVRGLPWVLRERRAVAPALEERLRTIERARQEQDAGGHATHLQRHAPHS